MMRARFYHALPSLALAGVALLAASCTSLTQPIEAEPVSTETHAAPPASAAPPSAPASAAASAPAAPEAPMQSTTLTPGKGPAAKTGDKVRVHYLGTFPDGKKFDASRDHGKPFDFTIGQGMVIKGWDQGVVGMKVGEKRKLVVPPSLAYGPRGRPGIPPNSTLVFEIDLLEINPTGEAPAASAAPAPRAPGAAIH